MHKANSQLQDVGYLTEQCASNADSQCTKSNECAAAVASQHTDDS